MIDLVFSAEGGSASGGENYTNSKAPGKKFFKNIIEKGCDILKLKKNLELSVNIVGEAKMRSLNKKYRNKNKPTDVLSFPLGNKPIFHIPYSTPHDLGDIFICLSIAKKEAKRENISIKGKLAQLTVHGFLHLCGYDHEKSKKEADKMLAIEQKILQGL